VHAGRTPALQHQQAKAIDDGAEKRVTCRSREAKQSLESESDQQDFLDG
jgi:hypothetical protein